MPRGQRTARATFMAVTALAALAGALSWPSFARAADCLEAISEANARKVFDALAKGTQRDGCALDEVHTEKSLVEIRWKQEGPALEPVLVLPSSCVKVPSVRGQVLSLVIPTASYDACPAEIDALATLVKGDAFGGLVPLADAAKVPDVVGRPPVRRWRRYAPFVAGGVALAAAITGGVLLVRRRRARVAAPPPAKAPDGG